MTRIGEVATVKGSAQSSMIWNHPLRRGCLLCGRVVSMNRKQILVMVLSLFVICGGAIAFSQVNTESIASIVEIPKQDIASVLEVPKQEPVKSKAGITATPEKEFLKVPVGNILLKPPKDMKEKPKRSLVNFPHSKHFNLDTLCQDCHHKWEGDAKLQTCSAEKCHDKPQRVKAVGRKKPDPDIEILYYKKAYHEQCITCHIEIKRQNEKRELSLRKIKDKLPPAGPTGCVKCHPKEEK